MTVDAYIFLALAIFLAAVLLIALVHIDKQRKLTVPALPESSERENELHKQLERAWEQNDTLRNEYNGKVAAMIAEQQANERLREQQTELRVAELLAHEANLQAEYRELGQRLRAEVAESKRTEAKRTAARSRTALVAKIAEHLAPILADFPYNYKDVRHLGEIFDFIVYDGLEDGYIKDVIFLEVKTGASRERGSRRVANPRERLLMDAIRNGRVRYEIYVPSGTGIPSADDGSDDAEGNDDDDNSAVDASAAE